MTGQPHGLVICVCLPPCRTIKLLVLPLLLSQGMHKFFLFPPTLFASILARLHMGHNPGYRDVRAAEAGRRARIGSAAARRAVTPLECRAITLRPCCSVLTDCCWCVRRCATRLTAPVPAGAGGCEAVAVVGCSGRRRLPLPLPRPRKGWPDCC